MSSRWLLLLAVAAVAKGGAQLAHTGVASWSPITSRAELPRSLPSAALEPWSMWNPRLPVGLFATSGNPAALAWELTDTRSDYSITRIGETGAFHRPLDPESQITSQLAASARTRLGARVGMIGDIVEEEAGFSPGPRADQPEPYGSSPLVMADTTASSMSSTRTRLEGAGGWRMGDWGAGVAAAYDTYDLHTDRAGFVRGTRVATPGIILGAARRFKAPTRLVIGINGGESGSAQTTGFDVLTAPGELIPLQGYRNTQPIFVQPRYRQRLDARTRFAAMQSAASVLGASVVGGVDVSRREEVTSHSETNNPMTDRWTANGVSFQFMAERELESVGELRITAHSTMVTGALRVATDSGVSFTARERGTDVAVELRTPISPDVETLITLALIDERHVRIDSIAPAETNLHSREPIMRLSAQYAVAPRFTILAGIAGGWYRSTGAIPQSVASAAYAQYIAPEVAMYASSMASVAWEGGIRWRAASNLVFSALANKVNLTADGFRRFDELPRGQRTATQLMLRATTIR